jgi:hypothetical protein
MVTVPATIRVQRTAAPLRDRLRAYKVVVDDEVVGLIRNGQDFRAEVPAGAHVIRMKIDWTQSVAIPFSVEPGETAAFSCQPPYGWMYTALAMVRLRPWVQLTQLRSE